MSNQVTRVSSPISDYDAPQIQIYHSPVLLDQEGTAENKLQAIFDQLKKKQHWLANQPVEAIIGLINLAREKWTADPTLSGYQHTGLNFLAQWCEPNRLRSQLDAALHGKRGHLDAFMPRNDITHSALRALPRGIAAHWLSGNVPLLGMFALIQSILSKNTNILKVSKDESQALPLLLNTFRGLNYTTSGGYTLSGDALLETLAIVYFERSETSLATIFSSHSDIRIAWGGKDAIEAISALPKKYSVQDIFFGPKLSMMAIGKEALDNEKSIRKLIRRAATDASVFDQFACASPHTIFVEEGGLISPLDFAEKLSKAMDKALIRLPTKVPDMGSANKIRAQIAEYDLIGESWHDPALRWTVLFDVGTTLAPPTYQRTVTVKAVKNIFDVVDQVNCNIQTVGLAMKGEKRLAFANEVLLRGAARCPDIGYMTHFDSPWDGVFPLDRMVRWVSLGGPV